MQIVREYVMVTLYKISMVDVVKYLLKIAMVFVMEELL